MIGVIGVSSGSPLRPYGEREIAVLGRFAQLASIALDNARLFATVQRQVVRAGRGEEALRQQRGALPAACPTRRRRRSRSIATAEIIEVNEAFCRLLGYPLGGR